MNIGELTQADVTMARDALLDYLGSLEASVSELEALWAICASNKLRSDRATLKVVWGHFQHRCPDSAKRKHFLSYAEFRAAVGEVLKELDGKRREALRFASMDPLRTLLEIGVASSANISPPVDKVQMAQQHGSADAQETEDEEESTTTPYFHALFETLWNWHQQHYDLGLGMFRKTKIEKEQLKATHKFFDRLDFCHTVARSKAEERVRMECAWVIALLNAEPGPESVGVDARGAQVLTGSANDKAKRAAGGTHGRSRDRMKRLKKLEECVERALSRDPEACKSRARKITARAVYEYIRYSREPDLWPGGYSKPIDGGRWERDIARILRDKGYA